MRSDNTTEARLRGENRAFKADITDADNEAHLPSKLTLAENLVLTIKVLAVAGLLIAVLWGISAWTSAK